MYCVLQSSFCGGRPVGWLLSDCTVLSEDRNIVAISLIHIYTFMTLPIIIFIRLLITAHCMSVTAFLLFILNTYI